MVPSIAMSQPASRAWRAASASSVAVPCSTSSLMLLKSEITRPGKPNSPRRMSVSSRRLPVAGTPSTVLKAAMVASAPAW